MSYVVHIFAWPNDPYYQNQDEWPNKRFFSEFDDLQKKQREFPNIGFQVLAKNLTARYPCITSPDVEDDDAAWTDGPLDGKTQSHVYSIGINSNLIDEVWPFVVQEAHLCQLNVFDDQQGSIFCPNGRVIRFHDLDVATKAPTPASEIKKLLPTHKDVAKGFTEELRPFLEARGFQETQATTYFDESHQVVIEFTKAKKDIVSVLRLFISREIDKGYVGVSFSLDLHIPSVSKWLKRVNNQFFECPEVLGIGLLRWMHNANEDGYLIETDGRNSNHQYRLRKKTDLPDAAKDLHDRVRKQLPAKLASTESLDRLVPYLLNWPLTTNPFFSEYIYAGNLAAVCALGESKRAKEIAQEILNFYTSQQKIGCDPLDDPINITTDTFTTINAILAGDKPKI